MKCVKDKKGFMVLPETEFEEQVVSSFQNNCECFVKCGVTPADIIGIAIHHKVNSGIAEDQQKQTANIDYTAMLVVEIINKFNEMKFDAYETDAVNELAAHLNSVIKKQQNSV